jgi:hypothetical protein
MDSKSLTKTGFCDKEIDNVTNNDMKQYILDNLYTKSGLRYNSKYAKIYNENYKNNLNNAHLVCLKSIGSPYFLFCTQINDVNYCFLIDKKIKDGYKFPKIFLVHYRFNSEIFNGTLFEVELLRDNCNKWHLLIGDIYINKGEKLDTKQITERMNIVNNIFMNEYSNDSFCNICPIMIKKYFDYSDIDYIINDFIPNLNYRVRGLYFIPLKSTYAKILYFFNDNEYKEINYRKKNKNISFRIIKSLKPDIYDLYLNNENKSSIIKHSFASIPNIKTSKWIQELTSKKNDVNVECYLNKEFNKWVPTKETDYVDCISEIS